MPVFPMRVQNKSLTGFDVVFLSISLMLKCVSEKNIICVEMLRCSSTKQLQVMTYNLCMLLKYISVRCISLV